MSGIQESRVPGAPAGDPSDVGAGDPVTALLIVVGAWLGTLSALLIVARHTMQRVDQLDAVLRRGGGRAR